jgi:hypothetical protein
MSHTVQVRNIKCTNEAALSIACDQLGLKMRARGKHKLFDREHEGVAVDLPGWRLPVVIDTSTGQASFDNYGGQWGQEVELDRLIQRYALEAAKMEAVSQGLTCNEEELPDGGLKLVMVDYAGA